MPKAATPLPHLSKDDFEARGKDLEEAEKAREEKEAAKRARSQARQEVEAAESEKVAAPARQKPQILPTPPTGQRGRILGVLAGLAGAAAAASLRGPESATSIGGFYPTEGRALDAACPPLAPTDLSLACAEFDFCLISLENLEEIAACAQSEGISLGAAAREMDTRPNWYTPEILKWINFQNVGMDGLPGLFGQKTSLITFRGCDLSGASFTGSSGILRFSTDATPCIGADFRNVTAVISDYGTNSFTHSVIAGGTPNARNSYTPEPSDNTFKNADFSGAKVTFVGGFKIHSPREPFLLTDFSGANFVGAEINFEGITYKKFKELTLGLDLTGAICYENGALIDCSTPPPPPIPTAPPPIPTESPPIPTAAPPTPTAPPAAEQSDSLSLGLGIGSGAVVAAVAVATALRRRHNRAAAPAAEAVPEVVVAAAPAAEAVQEVVVAAAPAAGSPREAVAGARADPARPVTAGISVA